MSKQRFMPFLPVVIISFFVLTMPNTATAFCLAPDCFPAGGCDVRVDRGTPESPKPFPIIIENSSDPDYSEFVTPLGSPPPNLGPFPWVVFSYKINNCKVSSFEQALPAPENVCGDNQFKIDENLNGDTNESYFPSEARWNPAGAGGINGWYDLDQTVRVFTWPSSLYNNGKGFYFITSGNVGVGGRPAQLKSGNKTYNGTLLTAICQGDQPLLQLTQKGFTAIDDAGNVYKVLVTFDQFGKVHKVEFDDNDDGIYEPAGPGQDQREVFSCIPSDLLQSCPGETVSLPLTNGEFANHCCQRITSTVPGEPTTYKSGQQTSCPMFIDGRWWDFCAGIF